MPAGSPSWGPPAIFVRSNFDAAQPVLYGRDGLPLSPRLARFNVVALTARLRARALPAAELSPPLMLTDGSSPARLPSPRIAVS